MKIIDVRKQVNFMLKHIGGRKFDTESATLLATWLTTEDKKDIDYFKVELYQTRIGHFFLYEERNPESNVSRVVANRASQYNDWNADGQLIEPISYKEAKRWVKDKADQEVYDAIFKVDKEQQGTKIVTVRIPLSVLVSLRAKSADQNQNLSELVSDVLVDYAKKL